MNKIPRSKNFDLDRMNNADHTAVAQGAMRIIDRLQSLSPETRVLSAAAVFMLLADHYEVRPTSATTVVSNLLAREDAKTVQFRAIKAYIANELS